MQHGRPRQRLFGRPHKCPRSSIYAHEIWASIHGHSHPRIHKLLGAQAQGGLPRFGQRWATTKFWMPITLYGQPRKVFGLGHPHSSTKSLDGHAIIWVPTKFCALPRNRVDIQRQRFLDVHTICMDTHDVLWVST